MPEPVTLAVLAKAPVAGLAKTRLAPALGADGAARLQARLIERTVATAVESGCGPAVVWCAPDTTHPLFRMMRDRHGLALSRQPDGDLGARMHACFEDARGPALVLGVDCPALTAGHLRAAAEALASHDAVLIPVEDGGYVLIGLNRPCAALFDGMTWSVPSVAAETRARLARCDLRWRELAPLWDVDTPADLVRMQREGYAALLE
jgi:uncharacterized protein